MILEVFYSFFVMRIVCESLHCRMLQETLDVWAPLANRVGLWNMKAPLEDLAFKQLHPAEYCELRAQLEAQQRPEALIQLVDQLRAALDKEGIR